ncbi:MAG: hypothetical protein M1817_001303 [Caeruleum heppii]|nr:MAG: hypothetical protein M1817_001303 [Caeruleum heppii]
MDLAKTLIRSTARAFYETKHVLAVDALMVHSALRDDDLALLLGMQTKELRKLCAKLEEHRLLAVHNRQETREGMQRPVSKTYYFIDYRQTIDAIKYRIYSLTTQIQGREPPADEKKEFFCPRCGSRWTQMQVLDSIGPDGFLCHKCQSPLERDESGGGVRGVNEQSTRVMTQLQPLLSLLPQIDEVYVPESTFELALNTAVPVLRNQTTRPLAAMVPVDGTNGPPTAVKGLAQTSAPKLEINLTSTDEKSVAEQAAEAARKAALAEQNALPVWHTNSTVSGEATALATRDHPARQEAGDPAGAAIGVDEDEKKVKDADMNEELRNYYALIAEERKREDALLREEEDDDDDDDDDDEDDGEDVGFQDVPALTSLGAGSNQAASSHEVKVDQDVGPSPDVVAVHISHDMSDRSLEPTSPSGEGALDGDGQRTAKKIKVGEAQIERDQIDNKDSEEDEEDAEVEFEDV